MLKTIKIGPHDWTIKLFGIKDADKNGEWGYCHKEELTIGILKGLTGSQTAEVLLHEIIHAIHDHFRLKGKVTEEKSTDLVSTGLTMVFKDNPEFKKWLDNNVR